MLIINYVTWKLGRSQWSRVPRRVSAAARLLEPRVRNPPGAWISVSCKSRVFSGRGIRSVPSQTVTGQFVEPVQISSHSTHFFPIIFSTVFPITPLVPKGPQRSLHHVFPTKMQCVFLVSSIPVPRLVHFIIRLNHTKIQIRSWETRKACKSVP